jgi:hypothetical protein
MSIKGSQLDAAGFCGRPLVRRVYKGLVVGVAVFLGTLVVLREPFRGYLAEVRVSGPATAGLDLEEGVRWIKEIDPRAAVVASAAGEISTRSQIRMTYVARQSGSARARLDELAARWLCQYLPERLTAYRREVLAELRGAVASAREREDAARERLDELRQEQLLAVLQPAAEEGRGPGGRGQESGDRGQGTGVRGPGPGAGGQEPELTDVAAADSVQKRLEKLRLELSQLLARCTEDHPEVIALRREIGGVEHELGTPASASPGSPSGPELIPAPGGERQAAGGNNHSAADHFVSTTAATAKTPDATDAAKDLDRAIKELGRSSRERQEAELRVSERMQELSTGASAADWSAEPAKVVTRLGGTPRSATLALASLVAGACAIVMFWVSAAAVLPVKIETTGELATLLEIPVVGNTSAARGVVGRAHPTVTRKHVFLVTRLAEVVVAVAAGACLLSIAVDPPLAGQVALDPFGALSEAMGRYLGG